MEFVVDKAPSYKQFVNNMQEKMEDSEFTNDMQSLLRPGITFNASYAYPLIYETFINKMEGKRLNYFAKQNPQKSRDKADKLCKTILKKYGYFARTIK